MATSLPLSRLHLLAFPLILVHNRQAGAAEALSDPPPVLSDPTYDARVSSVARYLGELYVGSLNRSRHTISDAGKGVALGNAAYAVASNWLIALSTGRRLVIRSTLLRALFLPPAGVPPEMLYPKHSDARGGVVVSSAITTYAQLSSALSVDGDVQGRQWQFKVLAQGTRRGSPLYTQLVEAGAPHADATNDTFLAAVAFRFLFSTPTPKALERQAEYSAAVHAACQRSAQQNHGWSDPFASTSTEARTPASTVDVVVHLRTWAEDSPCAKARGAAARFGSGKPFECSSCLPTQAIQCTEHWVRHYMVWRSKRTTQLPCALVLSDAPSAADAMARRLASIPGLRAVSEHSVALPSRATNGTTARSAWRAGWHSGSFGNGAQGLRSTSMMGWLLLSEVGVRVYGAGSTFAYSAALRSGARRADAILDLRCIPSATPAVRASAAQWRYELRMSPFNRHSTALSWVKTCDGSDESCWQTRESTNAAGMVAVMGDVDRCAHLRFSSLEEAKAACVARGDRCDAISQDGGLPCDYLLNTLDKQHADNTSACLRGQWPTSDGFPDFGVRTDSSLKLSATTMKTSVPPPSS